MNEATVEAMAQAMYAERVNLQHLPLHRVWPDLARAALKAQHATQSWQAVDRAPRDRDILAVRIEWWTPLNGNHRWISSRVRQTKWDVERQRFDCGEEKQPTHWTEMPVLPDLPSLVEKGEVSS